MSTMASHGADLVEVDLFRGMAVDLALGLGEPPEDPSGRPFHPLGKVRPVDDRQDVLQPPVMVMMMVIQDHVDVRGFDGTLDLFAHLEPVPFHAQAREPFPEAFRVRAGADEGPEGHVTADSRKTVEIGNFHRFTRCAKYPAPKPLSMFMTAMPVAQALSIARRAASPPKLAP